MIKDYLFSLFLSLVALTSFANENIRVDSNTIFLKIDDNKISYLNSSTADGTANSKTEGLFFDFSRISLSIAADDITSKKVIIQIRARKKGTSKALGNPLVAETLALTKKNIPIEKLISQIKAEQKVAGLVISIRYENSIVDLSIADLSGQMEFQTLALADEETTICAHPVFYRSAQLGQPSRNLKKKSFYIIEYDYNNDSQETGPNVFLYKSNTTDRITTYVPEPSYNVVAGRRATVLFKNYKPYYDKISLSHTWVDYNLEDQKVFTDILGLNKSETPSTAAKTGKDVDGQKKLPTAGVTNGEDLTNALRLLADELTQFWTDIQLRNPRTEKVSSVLSQVKRSITSCLGGPEKINPASLETYMRDELEVLQSDDLNRALTALQQIEDYSLYARNTFQIKNMDELRLNVSYFKNDLPVDQDPDPFVLPVLFGLKLDFSTGFIFSNLIDRSYLITDAPSVTSSVTQPDGSISEQTTEMKKIIEESGSKFKMGFGILSHFYPRLSKWVSLGFTSGFMIKENLAVQFPVGGSVMIGRGSRIVLSAGKVFGESGKLSDRYTEGVSVKASTLTNVTDDKLTAKKFNSGWFFGLTYNFGGTNIGK